MTLLSDRLLELRKQKKMSREDASELLHVDKETLARYERGNRVPQAEFIGEAARVYGVSADYLLGLSVSSEDKKTPPPNAGEGEKTTRKPITLDDWITVPIVSREWTACCGDGILSSDITSEDNGIVIVDRNCFHRLDDMRRPFAITCDGDCLESAKINDGDLAIINPAEEPLQGGVALVTLAGSLSLKRVYTLPTGDVILRNDYGSTRLTPDQQERDEFAVYGAFVGGHYGKPKALPL